MGPSFAFPPNLFAQIVSLRLLACSEWGCCRDWFSFGANTQHTGISPYPSQACINRVRWSTRVDVSGAVGSVHYGSPLISAQGSVLTAVRTTSAGGYRMVGLNPADGTQIWSHDTMANHYPRIVSVPGYGPGLNTGKGATQKVFYAGPGGTLFSRDHVNQANGASLKQYFPMGEAEYLSNQTYYDATFFVGSTVVVDSAGAAYYAVRDTPRGENSFLCRVDSNGAILKKTVFELTGIAGLRAFPLNFAPALTEDNSILYVVVVDGVSPSVKAQMIGLDPSTLTIKTSSGGQPMQIWLWDPKFPLQYYVNVNDQSSSSPVVGPDGDVFFGVLGSANAQQLQRLNGWTLRFDKELQVAKAPAHVGWDDTPTIVASSLVSSYSGSSSYLLFLKSNDYSAGTNQLLLIVDPGALQSDPFGSGVQTMKVVLQILSPTPNQNGLREWCINQGALDTTRGWIFVSNEDSKLYAWDLATNKLSDGVLMSEAGSEAYTPTLIGPDGTVYTVNMGALNAVDCDPTITATLTSTTTDTTTTTATTTETTTTTATAETTTTSAITNATTTTVANTTTETPTTTAMTTTTGRTFCQEVFVDVGGVGRVFTPQFVDVYVGDVIVFVWKGGFHNVVETAAFGSCEQANPLLFYSGNATSQVGKEYRVVVNETFVVGETYNYTCNPHCPGMSAQFSVVGTCEATASGVPVRGFFLTWKQTTTTTETTTTAAPTEAPNTTTATTTTAVETNSTTTDNSTTTTSTTTTSDNATATEATITTTTAGNSTSTLPAKRFYPFRMEFFDGNLVLEWSVEEGILNGCLTSLNVGSRGWVAIAFKKDIFSEPLSDGDWINTNQDEVEDSWISGGQSQPSSDLSLGGVNNVEGEVFRTQDTSVVLFRRLLQTGDSFDVEILTDRAMSIVAAYSTQGNAFAWNVQKKRNSLVVGDALLQSGSIHFGNGFSYFLDNKKIVAHGVLMTFAVGVCLVGGALLGRAIPKKQKKWLFLHAGAYLLGFVSLLAGLGIAIANVQDSGSSHFSTKVPSKGAHQILGIIVIVWAFLQGMFGVFTQWKRRKNSTEKKLFPHRLHGVSGVALVVVGFVVGFLGLYDWSVPQGYLGVWGGWFAFVIAIAIVVEIQRRRDASKKKRKRVEGGSIRRQYMKNSVPLNPVVEKDVQFVRPPVVPLESDESRKRADSSALFRMSPMKEEARDVQETDEQSLVELNPLAASSPVSFASPAAETRTNNTATLAGLTATSEMEAVALTNDAALESTESDGDERSERVSAVSRVVRAPPTSATGTLRLGNIYEEEGDESSEHTNAMSSNPVSARGTLSPREEEESSEQRMVTAQVVDDELVSTDESQITDSRGPTPFGATPAGMRSPGGSLTPAGMRSPGGSVTPAGMGSPRSSTRTMRSDIRK